MQKTFKLTKEEIQALKAACKTECKTILIAVSKHKQYPNLMRRFYILKVLIQLFEKE